jgi:ADP-heptose:LPS heptosyltransferase
MSGANGLLAELPRSPRIAVVRALQLGDLLCCVPALRALRSARPDAQITLIGLPWAADFVKRFSGYLDDFLEFPGWPGIPEQPWDPTRFQSFQKTMTEDPFDLAIQIHGDGTDINEFLTRIFARTIAGFIPSDQSPSTDGRFLPYPQHVPEVIRHLQLMERIGAPSLGSSLEFPLTDRDEAQFQETVQAHDIQPGNYVCLHPGARWPSRRWLSDRFATVADALSRIGLQIVLTGSSWESELVQNVSCQMRSPYVDLAGLTSLGVMARLIAGARLLITNDTGASHLAAAMRTPSVIVVLGSDSARWAPLDRIRHRIVSHPIDCRPCKHWVCPIGHECALRVSTAEVLQTAHRLLNPRVTGELVA